MSVSKKLLALAVPAALLTLGGCATGFPAQVSRFQALPAPTGQTFTIQATDPMKRGGLEFAQYASLVRQNLIAQGYSEAATPDTATLLVNVDYGVDKGQNRTVSYPSVRSSFGYGYGWGSPWYRPYYSRFGYGGYRRSPFYWGWDDPFWFGDRDVRSYTEFTSYLDLDIKRAADGQSVFEGMAKARSTSDELPRLVPNLVEAMFTDFPGRSGETVRITVAPDRERD
jgi:hypothetical protein